MPRKKNSEPKKPSKPPKNGYYINQIMEENRKLKEWVIKSVLKA